jgi:hypothetical protein
MVLFLILEWSGRKEAAKIPSNYHSRGNRLRAKPVSPAQKLGCQFVTQEGNRVIHEKSGVWRFICFGVLVSGFK